MVENLEKELKEVISKVNDSLMSYEKDFCSCLRLCDDFDSKERCDSFEHFLELRFNFESSKIPKLKSIQEKTRCHLFVCTSVEDFDEKRRKYKKAHIQLLDPKDVDLEYTTSIDLESLSNSVKDIEGLIGGKDITFNGVQKKIKMLIK